MADKAPIRTMDEAREAIDKEIENARYWVNLYRGNVKEAEAQLSRYTNTLYSLEGLRDRMEPEAVPATSAPVEALKRIQAANLHDGAIYQECAEAIEQAGEAA